MKLVDHGTLRSSLMEGLGAGSESDLGLAAGASSEPPASGANWALTGCCNTTQIVFLCLVSGYSVFIFFFWRWKILLPWKILTVFLHELGHATAAVMTCGKVTAMEVHADEGGVTKFKGGIMWIIVPAGYLGSAFWGMALVVASVTSIGSQIAGGALGLSMFVLLFYADNWTLRGLCIGFMALIAGFWACQLLTPFRGLQYIVLFMGVMSGLFSIYDCYDDLISRRVNGSDAVVFAEMTHTSARCWGVIWALISIAFMGVGIYLALVIAGTPGLEDK